MIDTKENTITISNAGHYSPIIIKKDRKEICFISSFSVICVWDEPAIKIVNLNI